MAIAMRASVTVSIAELSNGMFMEIERVTRVRVSAVDGKTEDAPGTSSTSSKVRASRISISYLARGVVHLAVSYFTGRAKLKGAKTQSF
jgi:hypothetical protein